MVASTWAQILFRKIGVSVDWTEELARVLFLTSVFLSIAVALYENRHIVVDFLLVRLPPRLQVLARIVFDLLIFVFLVSLLRGAAKMTAVTWESYMIAMNWMRTGYLYLAECISIVLMMIFLLAAIIHNMRRLTSGEPANENEDAK